jgi:adenylate cyclase
MSLVRVDVRNSTELVRSLDVDEMVDLMNQLIGRMVDVLFHYEATIDRYDGDAVIGFFGAPEAHDDDPVRAVRTGLAMLRSFDVLRAEWETRYTLPPTLGIGVGIATGDVVVGNIGSTKRLHYTTSGLIANLAARLMAKAPRGHVLMDESTWRTVQDPLAFPTALRARRPRYIRAKGFAQLVPVYRLRPTDLPHLTD